jgi:hypothetical protein
MNYRQAMKWFLGCWLILGLAAERISPKVKSMRALPCKPGRCMGLASGAFYVVV